MENFKHLSHLRLGSICISAEESSIFQMSAEKQIVLCFFHANDNIKCLQTQLAMATFARAEDGYGGFPWVLIAAYPMRQVGSALHLGGAVGFARVDGMLMEDTAAHQG